MKSVWHWEYGQGVNGAGWGNVCEGTKWNSGSFVEWRVVAGFCDLVLCR